MTAMQQPGRGRPPAPEARLRRARFLSAAAGALDVQLARGFSLEQTMDELGVSPRTLIRWLDDPDLPATLAAVHAAGTAQAA